MDTRRCAKARRQGTSEIPLLLDIEINRDPPNPPEVRSWKPHFQEPPELMQRESSFQKCISLLLSFDSCSDEYGGQAQLPVLKSKSERHMTANPTK
jgi:hypothetical protein